MTQKQFKVVIVGGSIAGLSLANMLQANNIDFVILEAYPKIAPQVGASIGMLPHGNRILDQLGLFEKILALAPPVDRFSFRNKHGTMIAGHKGMRRSFVERHGYPILFLDRQMVLQVLYDNITDKSKVLPNKRVKQLGIDEKGATAITEDGSRYTGDIVVGADGIHSTVRKEMWKIADKLSPGYIPASEHSAVPCDYSCIFGISKPCRGIEPGGLHSIFRENSSYLVNGGPNGRVYWFYFYKLPKRVYGSDIPRYTKADEEKVIRERENDNILPNLTFGDLNREKILSTMTTLPEYVFKKWHFDRIITIGDAAHKFEPIGGHGGNAAIETAATLINNLLKSLKQSSSGTLSASEIKDVFTRVQLIRMDRANSVMAASHEQQRTEALETPLRKFLALYILPVTDSEDVMFNFSCNIPFSERLDNIPLPAQPKLIPYKDELAAAPKPRGAVGWALIATYLACSLLAHYGMWVRSADYGLADQFAEIITTGTWSYDAKFPLKRTYTGISAIDSYLAFLSAAYMPGLTGWDENFGTLQMYFLGMLIAPFAIWTVESCRKRNALTPLYLPTIWFTLVQWAGIGIYMPLYYIAYTFISNAEHYWWPLSREVPIYYAKSLLPAILLGYVVPTVLMFIPWSDPATIQNFEALWQPSPMFVPLLTSVFAIIYTRRYPQKDGHQTASAAAVPTDLKYLKRIYAVVFILGLALHIAIMAKLLASVNPAVSISSVFLPDFTAEWKTLGEGLRALFMADFWAFYVASYVWCCSAVWDLKRVGRTNVNVGKIFAAMLLANFVLGPGAMMSACWYWREVAMARTSLLKPEEGEKIQNGWVGGSKVAI